MPQADFSPAARRDLLAIIAYLSSTATRAVAVRVVDRIEDKCRRLAATPGIGSLRPKLGRGVRIWVVWEYLIFYRPNDQGIFVLRVIHGRRRITRRMIAAAE